MANFVKLANFFLYRHIRNDLNIPFYIGIGKIKDKPKVQDMYHRAYSQERRNSLWSEVANKTDYDVEIMYECDDKN